MTKKLVAFKLKFQYTPLIFVGNAVKRRKNEIKIEIENIA